MKQILSAIFTILFTNATLANEFPSLMDVEIGVAFPHPRADEFPNTNMPTTQFKVPNYGVSKELFSEYQVVILNSSRKVVIVSAEASFSTLSQCQERSSQLQNLMKVRFPGFKKEKGEKYNLKGVRDAFVKDGDNAFYTLNCIRSYGPFWILDFNIRGKKEDRELNAAWKRFFENRR